MLTQGCTCPFYLFVLVCISQIRATHSFTLTLSSRRNSRSSKIPQHVYMSVRLPCSKTAVPFCLFVLGVSTFYWCFLNMHASILPALVHLRPRRCKVITLRARCPWKPGGFRIPITKVHNITLYIVNDLISLSVNTSFYVNLIINRHIITVRCFKNIQVPVFSKAACLKA
jgi:hypothetical protein